MKRWIAIGILAALCAVFFLAFEGINKELSNELELKKKEMDSTRANLVSAEAELFSAQVELWNVKEELKATAAEFKSAKAELFSAQVELWNAKEELKAMAAELENTKEELFSAQVELRNTEGELEIVKKELADLQVEYDRLLQGHGHNVEDPTYNQMTEFIEKDKTNEKKYTITYICRDFVATVRNNAKKKGIRSAYVIVKFPNITHAIVAFNTIEKGLVYIEPQTDELVILEIGKRYWESIIPKPGRFYSSPPYDDTVKKITIIW